MLLLILDGTKEGLGCIEAIHSEFVSSRGTSNKWCYYISSRELTAEQLLHHVRIECPCTGYWMSILSKPEVG